MKISGNVYQQLMSQAADKMTELYDKVKRQDEELTTLRAQLAEAREIIQAVADISPWSVVESDYLRQKAKSYIDKVITA